MTVFAAVTHVLSQVEKHPTAYWLGASLPVIFTLAGIAKCVQIARRPTTNARGALALGLALSAWLVTMISAAVRRAAPPDAAPSRANFILLMFAVVLMLAAAVLAIVALVEIRTSRPRFTQGLWQSVWALVISGAMIVLVGVGVISAVRNPDGATVSSLRTAEQPVAGERIRFDAFNFTFDAPQRPWVRTDSKRIVADSTLGFIRTSPHVSFIVIAEALGADAGMTTEALAEIARANLASAATTSAVLEERAHAVNGMEGIRLYSRATVGRQEFTYVHWVFARGAYCWQFITHGRASDEAGVRAAAEQMLPRFKLIDADLHAEAPANGPKGAPVAPFASERFGYSVRPDPETWHAWDALASDCPAAEFGAFVGTQGCFIVAPYALLGEEADDDAVARALLARIGQPYGEVSTARRSTDRALTGMELGWTRRVDGKDYHYDFRTHQAGGFAFLVGGWSTDAKQLEHVRDAMKRVSFDNLPKARFAASVMTPQQAQEQGQFLNDLGIIFYERQQHHKAIACFQKAVNLHADHVFAANLLQSMFDLRQYRDVKSALARLPSRLRNEMAVRVFAPMVESQLGNREQAMALYAAVFRDGCENLAALDDYVLLASEAKKFDEGLEAVRRVRARADSTDAAVLESHLLSEKGDHDAAIDVLLRQQARAPADRTIQYTLALTYLGAERYEPALKLSRALIDAGEQSSTAYMLRGQAELGLEQYRDAKSSFQAALDKDASNATASRMLTLVSGLLGQGNNATLNAPIEPVPVPADVLAAAPAAVEAARADDGRAMCVTRVRAVAFEPGKDFRTTEYRVMKVLTDDGVELLNNFDLAFEPLHEQIFVNRVEVKDEAGRLIASGKADDYHVVDQKAGEVMDLSKRLHIPIPGLRAGATVEIVITRRELAPPQALPLVQFYFTTSLPTARAALFVRTAGDERLAHDAPAGATVTRTGGGTCWAMDAVGGFRYEPFQPMRVGELLPSVRVGSARTTWAAEAQRYLASIESLLRPDPAAAALAAELTRGAAGDDAKLAAVVRHVQRQYTYKALEFGRRARTPQNVGDFLDNHYGDCKDHALLLCQLLRAAGVPAHLALVNVDDRPVDAIPTIDQFDHMIVYAPGVGAAGGRFFDCTDKSSNLVGDVPYGLAGARALVLDPADVRFVGVPEYPSEGNAVRSTRRVEVLDSGDAAVTETLRCGGAHASNLRGVLKAVDVNERTTMLQRLLFDATPDVVLRAAAVENLEPSDQPLLLRLEYVTKRRFNKVGGQIVGSIPAPAERFYLHAAHVERRRTPFKVELPLALASEVTLVAPAGYRVGTVAAAAAAAAAQEDAFEDAFSRTRVATRPAGAGLVLEFHHDAPAGAHAAERYHEFQRARDLVLSKLERTIVLDRAGS